MTVGSATATRRKKKKDVQWYRCRSCMPCSESEALRFVHNMDEDSAAVRLLLRFERIIFGYTPTGTFMLGDGEDERSRATIIGFAIAEWDSHAVNGLSLCSECVRDCEVVCSSAACAVLPALQDGATADDAIRSIWKDYSVWGSGADRKDEETLRRAFMDSEFPAKLASYAINNKRWADGMDGVLKRIDAWSYSLESSGAAKGWQVEAAVVSTIVRAFDSAFSSSPASPASIALSMALNLSVPDETVAVIRERWGGELPKIGFRMVEYALRVQIERVLGADGLGDEGEEVVNRVSWHGTAALFAAITCPGFMSKPREAFLKAAKAVNRMFTENPDDDTIRSWDVNGMPLIPYRILRLIGDNGLDGFTADRPA